MKILTKIVFLTTLIAGFQLPNEGLQNIAVFYVWTVSLCMFLHTIITLTKAPKDLPTPPAIRNLTYTTLFINTLSSIYLIYYDYQITGLVFLLALFLANHTKGVQNLMEDQK